jgi:hypothetical protein
MLVNSPDNPKYSTDKNTTKTLRAIKLLIKLRIKPTVPNLIFRTELANLDNLQPLTEPLSAKYKISNRFQIS